MKEYPVFVPRDGRHIAAIVTLPDDDPTAVVVFTTGGGGSLRSQRFRLWTRAARELADLGIASLRMEYAGVGDSTGSVTMGFRNLPVPDVVRVAEFAMDMTGTRRLGLCGNCGGARTSLKAVDSLPTCEAMVLLWLKPLARTIKDKPLMILGMRILERLPDVIRRVVIRLYWHHQERSPRGNDVTSALRAIGPTTDLLLMETRGKLAGKLPRFVDELREDNSDHRIELRLLDGTSMRAFQSLRDQEVAVGAVVEWFSRSFGATVPDQVEMEPASS